MDSDSDLPLTQDVLSQPISTDHVLSDSDVEMDSNSGNDLDELSSGTAKGEVAAKVSSPGKKRQRQPPKKAKSERGALLKAIRRLRPPHCYEYITAVIDIKLVQYPWSEHFFKGIDSEPVKYKLEAKPQPFSVTWHREEADGSTNEEKHILFIWPEDNFSEAIRSDIFVLTFEQVRQRFPEHKIYLAVIGKHKGSNGTNGIVKSKMKQATIRVQVLGVSTVFFQSPQELARAFWKLTRCIAERPFRIEKEKHDGDEWYARGSSKNCVRIDKDFNGFKSLWIQQLSQFNHATLDAAKAVASVYPTPLALYNAYRSIQSAPDRLKLLEDILIVKGPQEDKAARRLGPQMSRQIALMFTSTDGDLKLEREKKK